VLFEENQQNYDLNNRLLSTVRTGTDPQTATYTYDRNGNQLTRVSAGQTETRTYNASNQLTQVLNGAALVSVTYVYRADGLRHSKTSNHTRVTHVWNGAHIVLELNASNAVINRFYRGGGGRLLRSEHHGWYLHNARGDVVQRVDNAGALLHTYHYDAFGVERDQDEGNTNPFRFAGEYYDWETGTIYLRARVYNPRTGRFTQEDPHWNVGNMQDGSLAIMQAGNLYMYCIHNPVMFVDPSGLTAVRVTMPDGSWVMGNLVNGVTTIPGRGRPPDGAVVHSPCGYRFWRMNALLGHGEEVPAAAVPRPAAQRYLANNQPQPMGNGQYKWHLGPEGGHHSYEIPGFFAFEFGQSLIITIERAREMQLQLNSIADSALEALPNPGTLNPATAPSGWEIIGDLAGGLFAGIIEAQLRNRIFQRQIAVDSPYRFVQIWSLTQFGIGGLVTLSGTTGISTNYIIRSSRNVGTFTPFF